MIALSNKGHKTFNEGQFVDTVTEEKIKYALYSLSDLWFEVKYDSPKNKIIEISSFVAGYKLNRYSNVPNKI